MAETDKDPRILAAELAHGKLMDSIFAKSTVRPDLSKDKVNTILSNIESQLKSMKYSYMEQAGLAKSEMAMSILNDIKTLFEGYGKAIREGMLGLPRANCIWAINVLGNMPRRFSNTGAKPTHGIDVIAIQIRNISKSGELWVTKSSAGRTDLTIVTNIPGLDSGDGLAAALLPPAQVGGVISEAMFLGAGKIDEPAGDILDVDGLDTKEADGILYNEISKL